MLSAAALMLGFTFILIIVMEYNFRQVKVRTKEYLAYAKKMNNDVK